MIPVFPGDTDVRVKTETLFYHAMIAINDYTQRIISINKQEEEYETEVLQDLNLKLVSIFNLNEFFQTKAEEFPGYGIKECFISFYSEKKDPYKNLVLKPAYTENGVIDFADEEYIFPACEMVPSEFIDTGRRHGFIVEPLYFEDEQLGIVAFGKDFKKGPVYTFLQTQLSAAVKGVMLIDDKKSFIKTRSSCRGTSENHEKTERLYK